jgi:hypothetical protein
MKKLLLVVFIVALSIYSGVLLALEFFNSQAYVRNYFTDIIGPVKFYAINTSISVFFLWGTGLLFFVALSFLGANSDYKDKLLFLSQGLVFGYLGMDDRFCLHEAIGNKIHLSDHYVLLFVGGVEVGLLLLLGWKYLQKPRVLVPLVGGSILFGLMTIVDGFFPLEMVLRLSMEDLLKTWAGFCFLIFSYEMLSIIISRRNGTIESIPES